MSRLQPLSPFQKNVMVMALEGRTYKAIGTELGTSGNSIAATCAAIRQKGYRLPLGKKNAGLVELREANRARAARSALADTRRFYVRFDKPGGGYISGAADSQEFADAHLAAMMRGG